MDTASIPVPPRIGGRFSYWIIMKIVQCSNCNKDLYRQESLIKRSKHGLWYCNRTCRHEYISRKNKVNCPICGKVFFVKPYRIVGAKATSSLTCSRKCMAIILGGGSVSLRCVQCNKEFKRKKSESGGNNFCNRACMGKWQSENKVGENSNTWQGGYTGYYGKDWYKTRKEVASRDKSTCQGCGIKHGKHEKSFDTHHIKPARLFKNINDSNYLANLVTLCHKCHNKADILARWFFNQERRKKELAHPLQKDKHIGQFYVYKQASMDI